MHENEAWLDLLEALEIEPVHGGPWRNLLPEVYEKVSELKARVATLELANWQAERRASDLHDELTAACARERHLLRLLAAKTEAKTA